MWREDQGTIKEGGSQHYYQITAKLTNKTFRSEAYVLEAWPKGEERPLTYTTSPHLDLTCLLRQDPGAQAENVDLSLTIPRDDVSAVTRAGRTRKVAWKLGDHTSVIAKTWPGFEDFQEMHGDSGVERDGTLNGVADATRLRRTY